MADKKISAVSLLPEFLKTERNKKFLTSTLDQLIEKPQLKIRWIYRFNTNPYI